MVHTQNHMSLRTTLCLAAVVGACAFVAAATSGAAPSQTRFSLIGTWRTAVITPADAEATLRRSGLAKWIPRFRSETPITEPMTLVLVVTPKQWDLYGKPRGKPRFEIDYDARLTVRGNTLDKIHSSGYTTLRWSVQGRLLRLRWLSTTEPPFNGIPDKVFQYALYMTRAFTRAS